MLKIGLKELAFIREDIGRFFIKLGVDINSNAALTKKKMLGGVPVGVLGRGSFVDWFRIFISDVDQSLSNGQLQLQKDSIRLLDVYHDLLLTKHLIGWQRFVHILTNDSKTGSLVDELSCLRDLIQGNGTVEICNEDGVSGRKTADFILRNNQEQINFEVKSLEHRRLNEAQGWLSTAKPIIDFCRVNHTSYHMEVIATGFTPPSLRQICIEGVRVAMQRGMTSGDMPLPYGKLTYMKVAGAGEPIPERLWQMPSDVDRLLFGSLAPSSTIHSTFDALLFDVRIVMTNNLVEAARSQVAKAAKKLPVDEPNIIYLGLPFVDGRIFLDQVDMIYPAIFHEINSRRKRVNAVVIMAKIVDLELASRTRDVVQYERYVVPSMRPRTPLPSWFKFPWSNLQQEFDLHREGSMTFCFQPHAPLQSQRGAALLQMSSATGRSQLRVWQNYHNRLRFDIVAGDLPRLFVDADVSDIEPFEQCMAALNWKDSDVSLIIFTGKGENVFRPNSTS